ncbi:MAG: DUF4230 domain-containing protein [Anaerolineae bacterium]|jgi:hypothetical protein
MNRKIDFTTVLLVLILVTVLGGIAMVFWSIQRVTRPLAQAEQALQEQFEQILNPTPTVVPDPVTIVREVRGLSRLETAAYTVEKIITAESQQGPFAFLFGDRLIFVAHGQVIAGVDLARLEDTDIAVDGEGGVDIVLPEAEVFVAALDSEQSYVFHRDTGVIGMKAELETAARQAAEEEILEAALEDGILDMAQSNAESYIRHLILTLGFKEVRVRY